MLCSRCDECVKSRSLTSYDQIVKHYNAQNVVLIVGGSGLHKSMNPNCFKATINQIMEWTQKYRNEHNVEGSSKKIFLVLNPLNSPAKHKAVFAGEAHWKAQGPGPVAAYNKLIWEWLRETSGATKVFDRVMINPIFNMTEEANRWGEMEDGKALRSLDGTHPKGTVNHQIVQGDLNLIHRAISDSYH